MVASSISAIEDAAGSRPHQEPRPQQQQQQLQQQQQQQQQSYVDEKNRAANETSTTKPTATTTTTQPTAQAQSTKPVSQRSEKDFEAGTATHNNNHNHNHHRGVSSSSSRRQGDAGPPLPPRSAGAEKKEMGSSPRPSIQTDFDDEDLDVNPADFQGEVLTNDELPSPETIRRIENYIVLDRHGKTHTFKSLYTGRNVARRVLVIFVRHFFCGNCQEYLRTLAASITPESLLQLPIPTFIAVVGCGDPGLIDMYAAETGSPFPIYADPTRRLYEELGMVKTLALGSRPAYMRKSLVRSSIDSIFQGVKHIKSGLAIRGGDQRQIGGEFLFEPVNLLSPDLPSPVAQEFDGRVGVGTFQRGDGKEEVEEERKRIGGESNAGAAARHSRTTSVSDNDNDEVEEPSLVEEKKVTWCHRMRTTRDHAEIPELMEVLGLSGQGKPIKDQKRWSKAVDMRKGTGLSLAAQMSRMNQHVVPEGE
ncbi:Thioredoxin-like protein AAED1 [Cytospora mali]|uniref:Thioredoxin-like protein AAED1 n=1 Tax=Cytospora mali TaxID=578113 RepID=A0A194V3K7_CYTMA|nr:Thioredoxin-like protein AAED1 [Valsa mali var. pyri (nom. inval.)]